LRRLEASDSRGPTSSRSLAVDLARREVRAVEQDLRAQDRGAGARVGGGGNRRS
jgi:hypothetical protein